MTKELDNIYEFSLISLKRIKELEYINSKNVEDNKENLKLLFLDIIDILDSFQNKYESQMKRYSEQEESIKLIKGFAVIEKLLHNLLEKYGVRRIEFPENKTIYGKCKIIDTEPSAQFENETILDILKEGYVWNDIVIRYAEVIVVKN